MVWIERGADLLVADLHHVLVAGVGLLHVGPLRQQLPRVRVEARFALAAPAVERGVGGASPVRACRPAACARRPQLLHLARQPAPARARGACSRARCRRSRPGSACARPARSAPGACCGASSRPAGGRPSARRPSSRQAGLQRLVQRGHAVVVEAAGHGAEHRHRRRASCLKASRLRCTCLATSRSASARALAVELVDRDELGEVEHVDLLELAGGAELRRHHVHRHVDQRHDGGVALADAGGLDDDQVEAGGLAGGDARRAARRRSRCRSRAWPGCACRRAGPRCHGPMAFMRMRSPSSAPPLLRRDGSIEITAMRSASSWSSRRRRISSSVRLRLAGAAGAGDAEHRDLRRAWRCALQRLHELGVGLAVLQRGDQLRQRAPGGLAVARDRVERPSARAPTGRGRSASPSRRSFPAGPCAGRPRGCRCGRRRSPAARGSRPARSRRRRRRTPGCARRRAGLQQVDHVLEVLDVAALVGADRRCPARPPAAPR